MMKADDWIPAECASHACDGRIRLNVGGQVCSVRDIYACHAFTAVVLAVFQNFIPDRNISQGIHQ